MLGRGEYIVVEADESDGSFLKFLPTIAVVTNIDKEHLDYYKDINSIKKVFLNFIDKVPFYGLAVLGLDSEHIYNMLPKIKKRYLTYGLSYQADIVAKEIVFDGQKSRFFVYWFGKNLGQITLNLPGIHNVYNSLAGIAVGIELDIRFETIKNALENLHGVQRRLEVKGEKNGFIVIDDYAHHPTEIKATIEAVKRSWTKYRNIVVVFQPHRYTRTKALFDEFTKAFYQSNTLVVLPIYPAGEKKIKGVSSILLYESIASCGHKNVVYQPDFKSTIFYLQKKLGKGDILLTLGAGDVFKVGEALLNNVS